MYRIALIDDHAIVREGFRALIEREDDLAIVAEWGGIKEARRHLAGCRPDLVVLDLSLPDGGGLSLLPDLQDAVQDLRVIVLSMHDSEPYVAEAMARGAHGYVSKGAAATELVVAIRAVLAGNSYLSSDVSARHRRRVTSSQVELSAREHEVLALLAEGKVPKQIANELGIGVKTAYVHRSHVLEKLGVRSDVELYRTAVARGLLGQKRPTAE